jgi:hypothetical protein
MPQASKHSGRNVIQFALTQQSNEMKLAFWIQDVVLSNSALEPALKRLRRSYRLLRAGEPITDAEEVLRQVDLALTDAKIASLRGLLWFLGRHFAE